MFFIDTHFHTDSDPEGVKQYCFEAAQNGVQRLILGASSEEDCANGAELAKEIPQLYFTVGIHPHEAEKFTKDIRSLIRFADHEKLVAIGEIGLDFFYDFSREEPQLKLFSDQLELALEMDLPVVIHCRDKAESQHAYELTYQLLVPFVQKGGHFVLHCYAGDLEYAKKFLELGGMFGVGGMLTFRLAENVRSVIQELPMESLLLETDAPYLAPVPYRGSPNHSKYIPIIAQKLAELKNVSIETCGTITTANALRLFSRMKGVENV